MQISSKNLKHLREEALRLAKQGIARRAIASKLQVSRDQVAAWLAEAGFTPQCGRRPGFSPIKNKGNDKYALAERHARLSRFGHEYDDPNVRLLGDPPRHRSALAQRETASHE
jgi:hypothetical protein